MSVFDRESITPAAESPSPHRLHEAPIRLTNDDLVRLRALVQRHLEGPEGAAAEMLEAELDRAQVVEQSEVAADIVTMRSKVVFEDVETGKQQEAVLVYPEEADLSRSRISVLAPVGMALLGISRGQSISWPLPGARTRTLRVVSILYQPEAAGDLHLEAK